MDKAAKEAAKASAINKNVETKLKAHAETNRTAIKKLSPAEKCSALINACKENNKKRILILLENDAPVNNCRDNDELNNNIRWTPLIAACWNTTAGDTSVIERMLERGANINDVDNYGNSALMIASGNNNAYIVEILLNNGANLDITNTSGKTALMLAIESGSHKIAKMLLDRGADVDAINDTKKTALNWSIAMKLNNVRKNIVEKGGLHGPKGKYGGGTRRNKKLKGKRGTRNVVTKK